MLLLITCIAVCLGQTITAPSTAAYLSDNSTNKVYCEVSVEFIPTLMPNNQYFHAIMFESAVSGMVGGLDLGYSVMTQRYFDTGTLGFIVNELSRRVVQTDLTAAQVNDVSWSNDRINGMGWVSEGLGTNIYISFQSELDYSNYFFQRQAG